MPGSDSGVHGVHDRPSAQTLLLDADATRPTSGEDFADRDPRDLRDLRDTLPHAVLVGALVAWCAVAVSLVVRLWFFGDDFDFLLTRSIRLDGDRGLLVPHNEHWSTIPILVYRLNVAAFGLHHYLPYAVLPLILHASIVLVLFVALRRAGSGTWIALLTALVALFIGGGAGSENVLWDFQIGFLGSCLCGLLALLVIGRGPLTPRGSVLVTVVLVAGLMSSGIGLLATFWAGAFATFRGGLRAGIVTVALPAATFALWFALIGHRHLGDLPPDRSVAWRATLRGLAGLWSQAMVVPFAGTAILGLLILGTVLKQDSPLFPLAASGLGTLVVAYALFGYVRSGIGVEATEVSRYTYLGVIFCMPALSMAFQTCARWLEQIFRPAQTATWACSAVVVVALGSAQLMADGGARRIVSAPDKERLAAAVLLVEQRSPVLRADEAPLFDGGFTVSALTSPSVRRTIPDAEPGTDARLEVANRLQVDVRSTGFALPMARTMQWDPETRPSVAAAEGDLSCGTISLPETRSVTVPIGREGAQLRLVTEGSALITALVDRGHVSAMVAWPVTPRQPTFVGSVAAGMSLRVWVPRGRTTVCAGGADVGR